MSIQKLVPGIDCETVYRALAQAHRQSGRAGSREALIEKVLVALGKA